MTYIPIVDPVGALSIHSEKGNSPTDVTAVLSCVKDYPMRFSIRDLLWATVVVAMGLGWWLDRNTAEAKAKLMAGHAARLHSALSAAKPLVDAYCVNAATIYTGSPPPKYPDFSPLDEPLIEP